MTISKNIIKQLIQEELSLLLNEVGSIDVTAAIEAALASSNPEAALLNLSATAPLPQQRNIVDKALSVFRSSGGSAAEASAAASTNIFGEPIKAEPTSVINRGAQGPTATQTLDSRFTGPEGPAHKVRTTPHGESKPTVDPKVDPKKAPPKVDPKKPGPIKTGTPKVGVKPGLKPGISPWSLKALGAGALGGIAGDLAAKAAFSGIYGPLSGKSWAAGYAQQQAHQTDMQAYLAGLVRSDMTGDEVLAMNQALRKMTIPGSAPNSPGGMWSGAQGHAFVNSVKNPGMKETYMQALKDGTYQNLYMPAPAGYGGSREEWMHGGSPRSMAGMTAPQGPAGGYDVVAGDTLGEIAATHGTDVNTLLQLNPHLAAQEASGDLIHVGQKVALPAGISAQPGVPRPGRWSSQDLG
jgi:hypothetical protein